MFSLKFLAVLAVTFSLKVVLADDIFTDENKQDLKMVCCSGCKDKVVQEKIGEFYKCTKENFPEEFKKGQQIFKSHENDPEGCWTDMSNLLEEFKQAHEDNFKKLIACFESHFPDRTVLQNCHTKQE